MSEVQNIGLTTEGTDCKSAPAGNSKIKRFFTNKIVYFVCSFLGFLVFVIFMHKNFRCLEMEPFSWEEIKDALPFFMGFSLMVAICLHLRRKWLGENNDEEGSVS